MPPLLETLLRVVSPELRIEPAKASMTPETVTLLCAWAVAEARQATPHRIPNNFFMNRSLVFVLMEIGAMQYGCRVFDTLMHRCSKLLRSWRNSRPRVAAGSLRR